MQLRDLRNRARVLDGLADAFDGRKSGLLARSMAMDVHWAISQIEQVEAVIVEVNENYKTLQKESDYDDIIEGIIDGLVADSRD